MNLQEDLQNLGLHEREIKVYLYLLEQGLSTPPQIAKGTGIARTNCYNILQSLKEKGLIEEQAKGARKAYIARDPEALLRSVEQRREIINRILPDLRAFHTIQKNKPKIKFYDGMEQIKEIYWQSLSVKNKIIHAVGSTKYLSELLPEFYTRFFDEIHQRGIVLNDLLTVGSGEQALPEARDILKGMYNAQLLPAKYKDFPTDLLIWDGNVALITLQEPIFGTVLTNALLAESFRTMFQIMWDGIQRP